MLFWVLTLSGTVGRYQRFGRTYFPHFQGGSPHGVTNLKTNIDNFSAIRTEIIITYSTEALKLMAL
jgi:hypothetical protein